MNPIGILIVLGVIAGLALYVNFLIYEPIIYLSGLEDLLTVIPSGETIINIVMLIIGFIFLMPIIAYGIMGGVAGFIMSLD